MTITVVVPVRNGAHLIGRCLGAVTRQRRQADEILVLVGPSDDGTREAATALDREALRVVDNPPGDRASAINLALDLASSDLIAMVDAQSTLDPDYLETAAEILGDPSIAVVGGPMRPVGATRVGRAMAAALQSPFGVGDSQFHFEGAARDADSVYLGVYRRAAFDRVGRYNTALLRTEDDDINARIRADGMRIRLDPRVRSTYRCRDSLGGIWTQYHGYGYWKVALWTVRSGALRPRHLAPATFVLAVVGGLVAGATVSWLPLALLGILWGLLAIAAAATAPAADVGIRLLFPVVAMTMHLAYGVGMLAALASLPRLRRVAAAGAAEAARPA